MIPSSNFNNILYGINLRLDSIHFNRKNLYRKTQKALWFLKFVTFFHGTILTIDSSPWKQLAWWNHAMASVSVPARCNTCKAGQRPPEGCICSKSASNIWCCLSHSQDSGVQDWRGGNGKGSTHYYLWYSTSKMFVSLPINLRLSGSLEVFVSKRGRLPPGYATMIHWTGRWDCHPNT